MNENMYEKEPSSHKLLDDDCNEFDICFKYYEKAIEGRNFHYQNYNTWVNYYAIFTGALFVGYYSIIDKGNAFCSFLIVLLGCITSIAWYLTVKGHYHWMLSWIKVVQSYEEELAKIKKNDKRTQWYVYSVYMSPDTEKYHKNISSQKLTSRFTLIVCLAWSFLFLFELEKVGVFAKLVSILGFQDVYILVGTFMIVVLVVVLGVCILDKPSDVSKMKTSISKKQRGGNI